MVISPCIRTGGDECIIAGNQRFTTWHLQPVESAGYSAAAPDIGEFYRSGLPGDVGYFWDIPAQSGAGLGGDDFYPLGKTWVIWSQRRLSTPTQFYRHWNPEFDMISVCPGR